MKKQTKHSIKAHLLWSALILLSLLAVCAIPFALAQSRSRGTSKQSVAKTNAPAITNLPPLTRSISAQPSQTWFSIPPQADRRQHRLLMERLGPPHCQVEPPARIRSSLRVRHVNSTCSSCMLIRLRQLSFSLRSKPNPM